MKILMINLPYYGHIVPTVGLVQELVRQGWLQLAEYTRLLMETLDVAYLIRIYYMLHDLDYYLFRYAPTDVAPYVKDSSTIDIFYGDLAVWEIHTN